MGQAFVIHALHAKVTIYYARLPSTYLANIAKYGFKYLKKSPDKTHVTLARSPAFHLTDTTERVEFFKILAKLLYYMVSGRSHLGYLHNHYDNRIHQIVRAPIISFR